MNSSKHNDKAINAGIKEGTSAGTDVGISVVIPTYNYKTILQKTIDSLCQQSLDNDLFEVIVVDDGSSDGTEQLVADYQDKINIRYYYQSDLGFRVARARNIGIDNARFSRILFFDAGMGASPVLLEKHYQWLTKDPQAVVLGLSYGVYEFTTQRHQQLSDILQQSDLGKALPEMQPHRALYDCRYNYMESVNFDFKAVPIPWILCWTGHVSCSTAMLRQIGGFDEWFSAWGGEDVELGIRLHQAGCAFELIEGMEAVHYPHLKDPDSKQQSALNNIDYIHNKHQLPSTGLMAQYNWEDLLNNYHQLCPE